MKKIITLFERDFKNGGKINTTPVASTKGLVATEKLDGTNVRLTVRNHTLVRVEKRRNPDSLQKAKGIIEPWYVDAYECADDKYIMEAAKNTDLSLVSDGEWSGEALGPSIQGNPLNLSAHTVFLFSSPEIRKSVVFENVPCSFEELKEWLPKQKTKFGNNCGIEGIVWWNWEENNPITKIKVKDFINQ